MKHKHSEFIIAWAEGHEIQYKSIVDGEWYDHLDTEWGENFEYRIKPEPKPDVVRKITVEATSLDGAEYVQVYKTNWVSQSNLLLTFDGETGALKSAEVL